MPLSNLTQFKKDEIYFPDETTDKLNEIIDIVNKQEEIIYLFIHHLGLVKEDLHTHKKTYGEEKRKEEARKVICEHKWVMGCVSIYCSKCGKEKE